MLVASPPSFHRLAMARYRSFLFPEAERGDGFLVLDPRESHHLVRVFRAREGAPVEVLDGQGLRFQGRLAEAHSKAACIAVESIETVKRPSVSVCLVQAVPKGKAMDLILRMATEIGASSVQPIFTEQGEVQMKGERLASKKDKWRLTMIEACKQCGVAWVPELAPPLAMSDWLARSAAPGALRLVASLEAGSRPLRDQLLSAAAPSQVELAVGPEGDFSIGEYAQLRAAGFASVRLGANVLRAETAAAYLLSVVDQLTGEGSRALSTPHR